MNSLTLIEKYYPEDDALRQLLITHSQSVAQLALQIVSLHPELHIDSQFVGEAAMLHDIGIRACDASGIFCHGTEPYIKHGRIGAEWLRAEGLPKHARVCERHTGAGITCRQIVERNLPLPHEDFLPETIDEKLICYADKFFSKSHPERMKTMEQAEKSIAKFGDDGVVRFLQWAELFGGFRS